MTEEDWLTCNNCDRALSWLRKKVSNRKLRLFACACCRQINDLLPEETARKALETAEDYAEGLVSRDVLRAARQGLPGAMTFSDMAGHVARIGVVRATHEMAWQAAQQASSVAAEAVTYGKSAQFHHQGQLALLRDIFNPFRPTSLDPDWLTPTVASLAQGAYDERSLPSGHLDSVRLAVLADALEESGCSEQQILEHLRSPGPHVRGCWAVDLVLGRS